MFTQKLDPDTQKRGTEITSKLPRTVKWVKSRSFLSKAHLNSEKEDYKLLSSVSSEHTAQHRRLNKTENKRKKISK